MLDFHYSKYQGCFYEYILCDTLNLIDWYKGSKLNIPVSPLPLLEYDIIYNPHIYSYQNIVNLALYFKIRCLTYKL